MMRKSVMVMVLLAMVGAWAMPTSSELQKAQGLVNELMASDLAALRSGKKTPVEVADASMDYAAEAESEAGKFLFYRGAFDLYVKAKDYDKTADALEALRKAISDVDRDVLIGMLTRALKNVASENGGRLTALQRQLRVEAQAERQIKALRTQLAKKPGDAAVREKLAVALALSGDWKAALTEFAKVKGDVAKVADWELSYPNGGDAWTPATAADFWWGYAEGAKLGDAAEQAFHSHAAAWYKLALDDDSLTGIKKKLVEKRIAEVSTNEDSQKVGSTEPKASSEVVPEPTTTKSMDEFPDEDFGGKRISEQCKVIEVSPALRDDISSPKYQKLLDPKKDFLEMEHDYLAFEISGKNGEPWIKIDLLDSKNLMGVVVVNRVGFHGSKQRLRLRQVPLCLWVSDDNVKWKRVGRDMDAKLEYRFDMRKLNCRGRYLRVGREPDINYKPFHLSRVIIYSRKR